MQRHSAPTLALFKQLIASVWHSGRRAALVSGVALLAASAPACDQLTGEGDPNGVTDTTSGGDSASNPDSGAPVDGISPDDFRFMVVGGKRVNFGETYEPMTAQGVKPYSFSMNSVTLVNTSDKKIYIAAVELTPLDDTLPTEWTLRTSENEDAPLLNFEPFDLEPGEGVPIATRFFPQHTGVLKARFTITDGKGDKASIILSGRGRDAAYISTKVTPEWQVNWGHGNSVSKLLTGALVTDNAGNSYISGNATQWGDGFNHNITLAKFTPTGTVAWAKEWNEPYNQEQGDTGQNGQSGGSSSAIAHGGDGHIYVAGRRSTNQSNNQWQALVMKVAEGDGALAWAKGWVPTAEEDWGAEAYAVDASMSDRVLITGTVRGDGGILFAALSKSTGEPLFAYDINLGSTGVDKRGYSVAANANGDAYIVGWSGTGFGYLMRMTGCNTNEPTLAWVKAIGLGVGSSAHSVSMGSDGSAYVGFDIRGATTLFAFARFNSNGDLAWGRFYDERNRGDQHTQYVIKQHNDYVYVGGRIGLESFDYTGGDGLIVRVKASTGDYDWANVYYTGTTASTQGDHRVKGISFVGDKMHVLLQHWTGARNSFHYWGHWYQSYDNMLSPPFGDGARHLGDYPLSPSDITAEASTILHTVTTGRAIDIDTSAIWTVPPASVKATSAFEMSGNGSHNTAVLHRLTIND